MNKICDFHDKNQRGGQDQRSKVIPALCGVTLAVTKGQDFQQGPETVAKWCYLLLVFMYVLNFVQNLFWLQTRMSCVC